MAFLASPMTHMGDNNESPMTHMGDNDDRKKKTALTNRCEFLTNKHHIIELEKLLF